MPARAGVEVAEHHVAVWEGREHKWGAGRAFGAADRRSPRRGCRCARARPFDAVDRRLSGHFDLPARGGRTRRPVVFNPLVSLADTLVGDRGRFEAGSLPARVLARDRPPRAEARRPRRRRHRGERRLPRRARRAPARTGRRCFVGAEERLFRPAWRPPERFSCLFVGKLIPLHGLETILAAAALAPELAFRVVGSGQLDALLERAAAERRVGALDRVRAAACGLLAPGVRSASSAPPPRRAGDPEQGVPGARLRHAARHRRHACGARAAASTARARCSSRRATRRRSRAALRRLAGEPELAPRLSARRPRGVRARGERGRARRALARPDRARVALDEPLVLLLWAAIAAFAIGFSGVSILRHRSFNTGRFDLGNMVQAVWSTAHGRLPLGHVAARRADLAARGARRSDPGALRAALAALAEPRLLLVAQTVAIALGAVPVFRLARDTSARERPALGFALAYLLYPPVQWLTIDEFHPVALATPLLLCAIVFLDEDRPLAVRRLRAAGSGDQGGGRARRRGCSPAGTGSRRRDRRGLVIAAAGVAVSVIAIAVVIPHFRNGGSSAFYGRYSEVGGSPAGILRSAVSRPWHVLAVAFDGRGPALPVRAALAARAACRSQRRSLALAARAGARDQPALRRRGRRRRSTSTTPARSCRCSSALRCSAPAARPARAAAGTARGGGRRRVALRQLPARRRCRSGAFVPGGEQLQSRSTHVSAHDRSRRARSRSFPTAPSYRVSNSLGAHLSARRRMLSFPLLRDATWVAVDERSPAYLDRLAPLPYATAIARAAAQPGMAARLRAGRRARLPPRRDRHGVRAGSSGSRYAQKPSASSCAARSSSAAASGTAQTTYQGAR